jgi:formylglycine-generating enzyme required for sulfatase activity
MAYFLSGRKSVHAEFTEDHGADQQGVRDRLNNFLQRSCLVFYPMTQEERRMKHREKTFRLIVLVLTLTTGTVLAQKTLASREAAGIEFVKIQPGEFMMGCSANDNACNDDEKPAHRVRITKSFEIGKYEVTQAQWKAVMGTNPSVMQGDARPVESISKGEAQEFLSKLNALNDGYRYRLPTEAEWEYAARAGSTGAYTGKLDEIAWYAGNSEDETHPVGKKKPNAWGLYDMEGNVREWVQDFYAANYYSTSPAEDPTGPPAGARGGPGGPRGGPRGEQGGQPPEGQRGGRGPRGGRGGRGPAQLPVMRGGAWDTRDSFVRVSARYNYYGDTLRVSDVGFRAVRERVAQ